MRHIACWRKWRGGGRRKKKRPRASHVKKRNERGPVKDAYLSPALSIGRDSSLGSVFARARRAQFPSKLHTRSE